ncbi:MAG: DJ-1/PfpI family protein [Trebonia sp.]
MTPSPAVATSPITRSATPRRRTSPGWCCPAASPTRTSCGWCPEAVAFVKAFAAAGKPIAAICHGPWTLVEAGVVAGKTLTSWPSLRTDIRNAGGDWRDEQVVLSPGQGFDLITSRRPDDLDAFDQQLVKTFARAV